MDLGTMCENSRKIMESFKRDRRELEWMDYCQRMAFCWHIINKYPDMDVFLRHEVVLWTAEMAIDIEELRLLENLASWNYLEKRSIAKIKGEMLRSCRTENSHAA
jgi:hypothetical protein